MAASSSNERLRVFISYSRRDSSAYAADILAGLDLAGFQPYLDREDIAPGEVWEARLAALIQAADTIVYLVSPDAVRSERCAWEIEKAQSLAKRIVPLLVLPVPAADMPVELDRLNYISFLERETYARSLRMLVDALRTDLEWVREHTRLADQAGRWQAKARDEALLLRGADLAAAQTWMASWKAGAPEVTEAHRTFINRSAAAEAERANVERQNIEAMRSAQDARAAALAAHEVALKTLSRRTTVGIGVAGLLTMSAGGLAVWANSAERRFRSERERAEEAERNSIARQIERDAGRLDLEGQLAAYATSPGLLASDGEPGKGSPFTNTLVSALSDRDISLQAALARSRGTILAAAKALHVDQRPYLASDLNADIYLKRPPAKQIRRALIVTFGEISTVFKSDNTKIDAEKWSALLTEGGFQPKTIVNPKKEEFWGALKEVASPIPNKDAPGLFLLVWTGAGFSIDDASYLGVTDLSIGKDDELAGMRVTSIELRNLQTRLREVAKATVLIVDADFPQWREQKR